MDAGCGRNGRSSVPRSAGTRPVARATAPPELERSLASFHLVAVLAVATDRSAVGSHVAVVVAPEAAVRRDVTDVVRVHTEGDLHRGEDVAAVDALQRTDRARELALIGGLARVEGLQLAFDGRQALVLVRIFGFDQADALATHKRQ